ncbi:MAG: DNA polymerase III subunit alpha, partial [Rothia sp. (in: high G+C Gram-positive bacteria)]|nr:DNA polymerase III subunit alpha [Rothia sp. (in: high G+C Gram-positive bacteria)]
IYRPGPMGANSHTNYALRKNGLQEVTPIHPELEEPLAEILDTTYGLIVYQEQVMAIAQKVAGYSLGEADILRRAMGKKKKAELDKQYANFHQGMIDRGYSEAAIKALWDILLPFSDYAFNKAHTAAYGLVSYWTAYLKAHFPQEYMAALLTSVGDDKDKLALYLNECRRMGITVLPPDVNESALNFTPVGEDIRFGMGAIRNVGANVVNAMVQARDEQGNFESFHDFLKKVPAVVCNKRTIDSLVKAGAFDDLGHIRRALSMIHEEAVDATVSVKRKEAAGQFDLFGGMGMDNDDPSTDLMVSIPDVPEWDKRDKLNFEREMLGLYVSDHPLRGIEEQLDALSDSSVQSLLSEDSHKPDGAIVTVAGMITSVSRRVAKTSGNPYARIELEDRTGSIEVMFFGRAYEPIAPVLAEDLICTIKGRLQRRDDGTTTISAQELNVPEISADGNSGPVVIALPEFKATEQTLAELRGILRNHQGESEVRIALNTRTKRILMRLGADLRVQPNPALFGDLKVLLGPACLDV